MPTITAPPSKSVSHRAVIANVDASREALLVDERDVFVAMLPLHHTYATTCSFLSAVEAGQPFSEAVREAAHAMKSSNAQVGAHRLAGLCHQLELLGAMGQLPDRETLLTELQEEYQGVMHEMELLRARIPGTTER